MAKTRNRFGEKYKGQTPTKPVMFTSTELVLQPWFLPQRVALAIRRVAPVDYHLKMRYFFNDYGCMICKKDHDYGSNGMCVGCTTQIRKKLARSISVRLKPKSERRFDLGLIRQAKLAKKLLRNFPQGGSTPKRRIDGIRPANPVDEVLGPHYQRLLARTSATLAKFESAQKPFG